MSGKYSVTCGHQSCSTCSSSANDLEGKRRGASSISRNAPHLRPGILEINLPYHRKKRKIDRVSTALSRKRNKRAHHYPLLFLVSNEVQAIAVPGQLRLHPAYNLAPDNFYIDRSTTFVRCIYGKRSMCHLGSRSITGHDTHSVKSRGYNSSKRRP